MRIVSGSSSNVVYFVGFRTSDHVTRSTGLNDFEVYASINGSTGSTAFNITVTPSTRDATGIYKVALTDSTLTSLGAGVDNAELLLHILASSASANMDPVTRTIEVYRREVTTGQTLALNTSGKIADVESILSKVTSIEANTTAIVTKVTSINAETTAIVAKLSSMDTTLGAIATNLATANSKLTSIDANTTALIVLATSINTRVNAVQAQTTQFTFSTAGIVDANMVRVAGASTTPTNMNTVYDTNFATVYDSTNNVWRGAAASLSTSDHEAIAAAVWDEAASSHATAGTFGKHVGDIISKVTSIDTDIDTALTRLSSLGTHVDTVVSKVSSIDTDIDTAITNIAAIKTETTAIKAKTDSLTFTEAGIVDANIQYVNDVQVQGTGTTVDTWRPV